MKILITDPVHEDGIERLKSAGFQVDLAYDITYDELVKRVKDYHGLVVRSRTKVDRAVIASAPNLLFIGRAGVGLDNIDLEAAKERNIIVLNSPEAPTISVAELVFGLLLSLARKIAFCDRLMKAGEWPKKRALGFELKGKTLGIIGLGRIGREVAKRAEAFEMKVLYYDVQRLPEEMEKSLKVQFVELTELLKSSDIVTVHVPLIPQTYHMIDDAKLSLMRKGSILINTSRGGVIDTKALLKHLKNGHLGGACLDVFEHEPPKEPWELELISLDNVVVTSHIGAMTVEAQRAASTILAEKIISTFKGKTL
ncbi:MAG: hydroxyacid dehydrogenase [archaeon GB-1845-036]|nr:hydroxyacid dehydrogenase [Candidatus Culexmicrobium thermophilum]HDO20801.1 hydroxyacid dehydrogenase [Candidatus Bathyarchaeota archaeon]